MRKLTLLSLIFLSGCQEATVHEIEGCEYIITGSGGIVHKGNCPNPLHTYEDTTDYQRMPNGYYTISVNGE